jgi:FkbM family methyltransferase
MNYRGLDIEKVSFGNITSDALFEGKNQAIFDFYASNKDRYRTALDIGANIGVHSILMAKQGWKVTAFEPDPVHYRAMLENMSRNGVQFDSCCVALSNHNATDEFVRVMGNTTGSHIKGLKQPYGDLQLLQVEVRDAAPYLAAADFAKIDAEGAEGAIIERMGRETDALVEVSDEANARRIWNHMLTIGRQGWVLRDGWTPIWSLEEMPKHHSEGELFIGRQAPL